MWLGSVFLLFFLSLRSTNNRTPGLLSYVVLSQIQVWCFAMWSQSEQSCHNSSDFWLAVVWQVSQFCAGKSRSYLNQHNKQGRYGNLSVLPASTAQLQPASSERWVAWDECLGIKVLWRGTDRCSQRPWCPESLDKICSCEAVHITISPLLALAPDPHIPHYRSNETSPQNAIVKLLAFSSSSHSLVYNSFFEVVFSHLKKVRLFCQLPRTV